MAASVSRMEIEVLWCADGTTRLDEFTAEHAISTLFPRGRLGLQLFNGADKQGPVSSVQYAQVYRVLRRPLPDEESS